MTTLSELGEISKAAIRGGPAETFAAGAKSRFAGAYHAKRVGDARKAERSFKGANQARAVDERKYMQSLRPKAKAQDWNTSQGKWGRTGNGATGGHVRYQ